MHVVVLAVWCQDNNLSLNVSKTKELIMDYRKRSAEQAPISPATSKCSILHDDVVGDTFLLEGPKS
jgi:hypothetical protein